MIGRASLLSLLTHRKYAHLSLNVFDGGQLWTTISGCVVTRASGSILAITKAAVERNYNFVRLLGAAVAVLSLAGCNQKPDDVCDQGVPSCASGFAYGCYNFWGNLIATCKPNISDAHEWCSEHWGGSNAAFELNCQDYAGETGGNETGGDPNWEPRIYVHSSSSTEYTVDYALVYQIKRRFRLSGGLQHRQAGIG